MARASSPTVDQRTGRLGRRGPLVALVALTALAALIRLPTLGSQSLWLDEALTAHDVRGSLGDMFRSIANTELTPPLYFVIAWVWTRIVGTSEVGFRLLSVLAGTATVPLAYAVARRLGSTWAGLLAAAFVATSALMVWFSQEARAYALFVFLSALTILTFLRALERPTNRALWSWALCSAAALLTHYFAGFLVAPEALWLLRSARRRALVWMIVGLTAIEIALVPLAVHQADAWPPPRSSVFQPRVIATNIFLSFTTNGYPIRHPFLVGCTVAVVAAAFVLGGERRDRLGFRTAILLAVPTLLLPLFAQAAGYGIYYDRHLMGAWLPLAVALAIAFAVHRLRYAGVVVATILCAGSLVLVARTDRRPVLQRDDWKAAFASLGTPRESRAIVTNWTYERVLVQYYVPSAKTMPSSGEAVRELDLVGVGEPPPVAPPRGFRMKARRRIQHLTVVEYRSPKPIELSRRRLKPSSSLPRRIGVFIERPQRAIR